ncbi:hypothetical protein AB6A40_003952 [Gnathostoma spinigerum]|uniref:Uncharacterized protein n=1 Tax=Gnathostoma spinigerum TaxID=75299 RepID=A0ABD6EB21_9BILA
MLTPKSMSAANILFATKFMAYTEAKKRNNARKATISTPDQVMTFYVEYAGLLQNIRGDIDPSGRTDLLKILDRAKTERRFASYKENEKPRTAAALRIHTYYVSLRSLSNGQLLMCVPSRLIASVGFIREERENLLPIRIGEVSKTNPELFDLAVIYCPTYEIAATICGILGNRFSEIYEEAASAIELKSPPPQKTLSATSTSHIDHHHPQL